jgi:uncharacterized protein (TIGR00251 family)
MPGPVRETSDGTLLTIRVLPRAKRSEIAGLRGEAVLVRLAAPPVDGAANRALVAFLAESLNVPQKQVTLVAGGRGRLKMVAVAGLTTADVEARFRAYGVIAR